jgi:hypothetical protein
MAEAPENPAIPSPASSRTLAVVASALAAISGAAAYACLRAGAILFYGDAEAHLNIARRVVDSRTPGPHEVGTVWLPVPHLLMALFAQCDVLWQSGLAGTIPGALCFVAAGVLLFAGVHRLLGRGAAIAALAVFALNPNLLYLQSIPMTEPLFFAAVCAVFYCAVLFRTDPAGRYAVWAGLAGFLAALTRYEGWFLVPFAALYFCCASPRRRFVPALLFAGLATLGPLLWIFFNWWWWRDGLEFLHGTLRALRSAGSGTYPGDHQWVQAWSYYWNAVVLCAGLPLVLAGLAGVLTAVRDRRALPLLLLAPAPFFYIWTIHSGGIRLFVPQLYPFGAYNTRYGLAPLPLLAVALGALVARISRAQHLAGLAVGALVVVLPWIHGRWPENAACWKEARDTSQARRAWTAEAAAYLRDHYRPGEGLLMAFGDGTGALREAGIPLQEAITPDNGAAWQAVLADTARASRATWALAVSGDRVSDLVHDLSVDASCHELRRAQGAPMVEICRLARASPSLVASPSPIAGPPRPKKTDHEVHPPRS